MKRYIVYRLLQGVVLLCLVATIVFFLGRLTGNPVDLMLPEDATPADRMAMIKALGLDGSLFQQFTIFVGNALHGDLGTSIRMRQRVLKFSMQRLHCTRHKMSERDSIGVSLLQGLPKSFHHVTMRLFGITEIPRIPGKYQLSGDAWVHSIRQK